MKFSLLLSVLIVTTECFAQSHDTPEFYLKSKRKKISIILQAADFQTNDAIADIGAGIGWFDVALGIYKNDLRFSLEDIDSGSIKKGRLMEAVLAYSKIKGYPINCTYQQMVGTVNSTQLPTNYFDKVLLIDTFHHLTFRDSVIRDIKRILKINGKLVVLEVIARKKGEMYKSCKSEIFTQEEIIHSFSDRGFQLTEIYKTVKSSGKRVRVFTFQN